MEIIDITKAGDIRKVCAISIIPSQNSEVFHRKHLPARLLAAE
jgi:hypothetical protein